MSPKQTEHARLGQQVSAAVGGAARTQCRRVAILFERLDKASLFFAQRAKLERGRGQARVVCRQEPFERCRGRVRFAELMADLSKRLLVVEIRRVAAQRLLES